MSESELLAVAAQVRANIAAIHAIAEQVRACVAVTFLTHRDLVALDRLLDAFYTPPANDRSRP